MQDAAEAIDFGSVMKGFNPKEIKVDTQFLVTMFGNLSTVRKWLSILIFPQSAEPAAPVEAIEQ